MSLKILGALLVVMSCGGIGFSKVAAHRREENALQQFISALDFMSCELQYRMTPLPELCKKTASQNHGCVQQIITLLGSELERQIAPDPEACMYAALSRQQDLPGKLRKCLLQLGTSLGRFDLSGQVMGIEAVKKYAAMELDELRKNRDVRLRGYRTLGLCAGCALAIIFL